MNKNACKTKNKKNEDNEKRKKLKLKVDEIFGTDSDEDILQIDHVETIEKEKSGDPPRIVKLITRDQKDDKRNEKVNKEKVNTNTNLRNSRNHETQRESNGYDGRNATKSRQSDKVPTQTLTRNSSNDNRLRFNQNHRTFSQGQRTSNFNNNFKIPRKSPQNSNQNLQHESSPSSPNNLSSNLPPDNSVSTPQPTTNIYNGPVSFTYHCNVPNAYSRPLTPAEFQIYSTHGRYMTSGSRRRLKRSILLGKFHKRFDNFSVTRHIDDPQE